VKTSKKKLRKMIHEEKAAARDYRKRGYSGIAKQETSHAKKLELDLKKRR
jgi:hypothetical protein